MERASDMKWFLNAVILVLISASTGCITHFKEDDPFGRAIPKRANWRLASGDPVDSADKICEKSVYVADLTIRSQNGEQRDVYIVRRFFESGQYMSKIIDNYSCVLDMNTFSDASIGYYKVEGDMIITEAFSKYEGLQYVYSFGEIMANGDIFVYGSGLKPSSFRVSEKRHYRKIGIEGLVELEPDW